MQKWAKKAVFLMACFCLLWPASMQAAKMQKLQEQTQMLKEQLQQMQKSMQKLQQQLENTEKKLQKAKKEQDWNKEDIKDLQTRVDKNERHSSADHYELSASLEPKLWSIQMQDVRCSCGPLQEAMPMMEDMGFSAMSKDQVQAFMTGDMNGFMQTLSQEQQAQLGALPAEQMQQFQSLFNGMQEPEEVDVDNDVIRTLRFRLRLDGEFNKNLRFAGRIAAYKVWGDSVGINFNRAGMEDVSFDGTTASDPNGDELVLERAYFVYKNEFKDIPWHISVGRRPSTEGPPLEYKKNLPAQGGTPFAHIINWQFDGASLHFDLDKITGIPGFDIKFCYGSGFESQYGTSSAFLDEPKVEDVDLYGVIGTLYESYIPKADMELSLGYNFAMAPNITDGFTGLTVMPFAVSKEDGLYSFNPNEGMYISRTEPTSEVGDWYALSVSAKANLLAGDLDVYLSGAWSHTEAESVSENPMYEMLGLSLLSSYGDLEDHDGYSFYGGFRYNVEDLKCKLGLEYNYGSKYWFNFTGAEENLIGSKLAARGHVLEPYYIQSIIGSNFYLRLGAQFYWFNYSGSGNPLGEPVDVDKANGADSLFPVIDKMQQYYLSAVFRF